jgi:hypothetical protein
MPRFLIYIFQLAHLLGRGFRGAVFIFSVVRECRLEFHDTEMGENIADAHTVGCGAAKACGVVTNYNLVLTMVKVSLEHYISNITECAWKWEQNIAGTAFRKTKLEEKFQAALVFSILKTRETDVIYEMN